IRRRQDLDETHAAVRGDRQPRVPAVVGDVDALLPRGRDDGLARREGDFLAVQLEGGHERAHLYRRGRPMASTGLPISRAPRALSMGHRAPHGSGGPCGSCLDTWLLRPERTCPTTGATGPGRGPDRG